MSKQECKRLGCKQEAMPYPKYGECCSLYCRDVHDLDVEITELVAALEEILRVGTFFRSAIEIDVYDSGDGESIEKQIKAALAKHQPEPHNESGPMEGPEQNTPLEWCRRLAREGLTNSKIARVTGFNYGIVRELLRNYRAKVKK